MSAIRKGRASALFCAFLLAGCGWGWPLPEVDHHRIVFDAEGKTPDELQAKFGPPAFIHEGNLGPLWSYPIRDVNNSGGCCVPAPRLEMVFDAAGILRGWRFAHPVSGETLPVRETLPELERWRASICDPPPLIMLSELVPGTSAAADVERHIGTRVRKFPRPGGEVWTFYVDRPSVAYIPSFLYQIPLYQGRATTAYPEGYWGRPLPFGKCPSREPQRLGGHEEFRSRAL